MTREQWLNSAVNLMAPMFTREADVTLPDVRVSVGWPGGRGRKNTTIGQCWSGRTATDGVAQIFISPVLADPVKVLSTLAHELVHAAVGTEHGHKAPFAKVAKSIGLTGKMTATVAGESLVLVLEQYAMMLGEYPHAALNPGDNGVKKQTTRMLKAECPTTGYTVRLTRKWIDEYGYPMCPCCHDDMIGG